MRGPDRGKMTQGQALCLCDQQGSCCQSPGAGWGSLSDRVDLLGVKSKREMVGPAQLGKDATSNSAPLVDKKVKGFAVIGGGRRDMEEATLSLSN